ncbi:sporulation protein [Parageobacillus galactosidasius]|uniref:Sporulation protein SpoOM n=1 Tax=Parageobacillus galactosidasius TaxID=883812 RepID=A0A226QMP9_9BACL|nr:sporulation protein [Parageobacillus galactosidasius]OXB93635.1 sporulation protein SpoOM [Parageobacillus galactosidasius]
MLKKLLSKLGVGAAKVDLVLHHPHVRLGEKLEGEFFIEGGTVEQRIRKLEVELQLIVQTNGKAYRRTVAVIPVSPSFTIQPGGRKVLPFSYVLPLHLPITRPSVGYTFVTRLDIADGVDAFDQDAIRILPPLSLEKLFHAFEKLGFREKPSSGKITAYGQEFAFFPTEVFKGTVQEVEFSAFIEENGIRLFLEVDVWSGFGGFHEREIKREIFLSDEEIEDVEETAKKLHTAIEEMIEQPHSYAGTSYVPHASYPPRYVSHHHGHGMAGAIGGFAAGMLAGMAAEELLEDVIEEALDDHDLGDMLDVGDWFDGGDDII